MHYLPRLIDAKLAQYIRAFGAVSLRGPKWCGKTTTCLQQAGSAYYLTERNTQELARINPENLFSGNPPILLDEWQRVPELWDAVRSDVDRVQEKGRFLLTGSTTPKHVHHSGTGRIARLKMKSMTLSESGESSAQISLSSLFSESDISGAQEEPSLESLINLICRGGWPASIGSPLEATLLVPREYVAAVCDPDAADMEGEDAIRFNAQKMRALLHAFGRTTAQLVNKSTLLKDFSRGGEHADGKAETIRSRNTLDAYIDYLERSYVIEEQPAWNPALRSPLRLRISPKWHLIDPSLAVAAMGATPEMLKKDVKTLGFLFESLCYRDLSVYAACMDAQVYHYRDNSDLEVDASVERTDQSWGAFEVKLGAAQVDDAAATLNRLERKMALAGQTAPSCKCVIVGQGRFAYRRPDGVAVVPITMLGA